MNTWLEIKADGTLNLCERRERRCDGTYGHKCLLEDEPVEDVDVSISSTDEGDAIRLCLERYHAEREDGAAWHVGMQVHLTRRQAAALRDYIDFLLLREGES